MQSKEVNLLTRTFRATSRSKICIKQLFLLLLKAQGIAINFLNFIFVRHYDANEECMKML